MHVLYKIYLFCGSVSTISETLIKQFTFYSEVFFFPLSLENNPLYPELKLGLQLYTPC